MSAFSLRQLKNKIIFNFMKLMATKKIRQQISFSPTQFVSNLSIKMPKPDSFLSIYPQPSPKEFYSGSDQLRKKKFRICTYAMASIMSSPISTAFLAWSLHGSGSPDTQ